MRHADSPLIYVSFFTLYDTCVPLTGGILLVVTIRRRMVSRVKYLEDCDFLARHLAEVVEAKLVAPLGQVAASNELVGDILQLLHIIQRYRSCITDGEWPLLYNTPERSPQAEDIC